MEAAQENDEWILFEMKKYDPHLTHLFVTEMLFLKPKNYARLVVPNI